jgi:outer membrane protein assembly factor BamA
MEEHRPAPFLPGVIARATLPTQEGLSSDPKTKEAPSSPAAKAPQPDSQGNKSSKRKRSGEILVAPIPILSPTIGSGVVLVGGYIFPFSKNDKVSPPSIIGGGGLVTSNHSRGFALGGQLYFKENRYRATVAGGNGTLRYNLYGVGPGAGDEGKSVPVENRGQFFYVEFLRRVGWNIFVGPRYQFVQLTTGVTVETSRPDINELLKNVFKARASALGLRVLRETRDSTFYPTRGGQLDLVGDFFAQSLGSKFSYQSYSFSFNRFSSLSRNQVLAYRFTACGVNGNAPFYALCMFGVKNDLRGYEAGRYLDRRMFATQLEYRLVLPKRFGLVAFGGVGEVAPSLGKFNTDNLLPSAGAGLRFALSKKHHVNYRIDYAVGKNGHTWSMGVGEAF